MTQPSLFCVENQRPKAKAPCCLLFRDVSFTIWGQYNVSSGLLAPPAIVN
jgi:hypothetical protein